MTDIIMARHGETEWNVKEIFRGTADIELNPAGVKQAALLAEYLSEENIEAVYSSPLKRARATAEEIARYHKLPIEIAPGLIDFNYGEWQGLSHDEVKARYPELYRQWLNEPERVKIPGGETLDDVRRKMLEVTGMIIGKHNGRVILVTHRVPIKIGVCALLGLDNSRFWNIRQDNAAITTFAHRNGRYILVNHNETCYLKPLRRTTLDDF